MSNKSIVNNCFYYIISLNTKNINAYFRFFKDSDILNIALKFPAEHVWTVMCAFMCVFNVFSSINNVMLSKVKV